MDEVLAYYQSGVEDQRLQRGIGQIEFERTKEILGRFLPKPPAVIYDIGGGTGVYSFWLAQKGYEVHLFDLTPEHIEKARQNSTRFNPAPLAEIEIADGRELARPDRSADVALVMGPLYHIPERSERVRAVVEARRVLKPGGWLFATAISRFGNLLYGITTFGKSNWFLKDPAFLKMLAAELSDGQHIRPAEYPWFIARAYFHLASELKAEVEEAGFDAVRIMAVEGPGWMVSDFEQIWQDENHRKAILEQVRAIEEEPSLFGLSPHILALGRK